MIQTKKILNLRLNIWLLRANLCDSKSNKNMSLTLKNMKTKISLAKPSLKTRKFNLDEQTLKATNEVTHNLNKPEKEIIKSDLLKKIMDDTKIIESRRNMNHIFSGMKTESKSSAQKYNKPTTNFNPHLKKIMGGIFTPEAEDSDSNSIASLHSIGELRQKIDLFGAKPLNIFYVGSEDTVTQSLNLTLWNKMELTSLRNCVKQPPFNSFQDLIQKTEKGLIWKFPIDNEQDLKDEVPFHEHIFIHEYFLEQIKNLPADHVLNFPTISHYMELVCTGLSKNPYYTVAEKRNNVQWYMDYFTEKSEIIKLSYEEMSIQNLKNESVS